MKPTLANSVSPSERSHLFHICEKKLQATLLWDCIPIGRSKLPNSTYQSIAIALKFMYNVKNRKLFY